MTTRNMEHTIISSPFREDVAHVPVLPAWCHIVKSRNAETMRTPVSNLFENAASENPDILEKRVSSYERHHDALFVAQKLLNESTMHLPKAVSMAKGELGHHHEDSSMHLYLSPADARQVIEKGWGERHRLSVPTHTWFRHIYGIGDTYLMI
ncbi:hypothetical protein BN1723_005443 [Verticillium longisporum]|nr:hypothetical protein BN1723_005443 [Verticillium longisporum]